MIVAIDGPAGSGKGTVTKEIAKRIGLINLDTGATYRCVALASIKAGLPLSDEDGSRTRTYKVKVYNSSSKKEKVKIFIFDDKEMVSLDNCHNKLVGREFIKYSINGNESIFLGDEEKSIISEELDAKESKTYIIRCWVSDTYTENDVVHYHGTIVVKQDNMKKEK